MKKIEAFDAIAVYSGKIPSKKVSGDLGEILEANEVGVWLGREISSTQRMQILAQNDRLKSGHIAVRTSSPGHTAVAHLVRVKTVSEARKAALALARTVAEITGARTVLRELSSYRAVSRTLAT